MYYLGFNFESNKTTITRFVLYSEEKGMKYENFDNFIHSLKISKRKFYLYRDIIIKVDETKFKYFLEKMNDINFAINKKYIFFLIKNDLEEYAI